MATLNWPGFGIATISPTFDQPSQSNVSGWTGTRTTVTTPWHGKWSFKVQLATTQGDAAFQAARAFFTNLGGINTFHLPAVEAPQNGNTGVTVATNAAQGATSLSLTGLTTALVAGNMATINGQLLSITSVGSLSGSAQTISFKPALRAAAAATTAVETAKPYALVYTDTSFSWDLGSWRRYGLSFNAYEAVGETDGADPALDVWTGSIGSGGSSSPFSFPQLPSFTTRSLLAGVPSPTDKQIAYLTESGREGVFVFSTANLSTNVSGDSAQNTYVAPSSDTTGASGAWVRKIDATFGTQDFSASPAAQIISLSLDKTWAGKTLSPASNEPISGSDYRALLISTKFTGTHGGFQQNCAHLQCEVRNDSSPQPLSFAQACEGYVRIGLGGSTGGNVTAANVFAGHVANESPSAVIPTAIVFRAKDTDWGDDVSAGGTITKNYGHYAGDLSHATKLTTEAAAYYANNMTTPGAGVIACGVLSDISAGTGKYFLYGRQSAVSVMVGGVRIGDTTAPTDKLEVKGYTKLSLDGSIIAAGSYHERRSTNNTFLATDSNSHATAPNGWDLFFSGGAPNDTTNMFLRCRDNSANRLKIWSNGNVQNTNNSYGALSDEKLKTGIRDATPQLADIRALKVRKFRLKANRDDAAEHIGLIAQEAEQVSPGLVYETPDTEICFEQEYVRGGVGEPDIPLIGKGEWKERPTGTVTKGVNYSVLYMKAVKALQEVADELDALKAEVAALKAAA